MIALLRAQPQRYIVIPACTVLLLTLLYFLRAPSGFTQSNRGLRNSLGADLLSDVYNETLGFQKILVLNLPARTDRRDALTLTSTFTGLKFERVDGVLGADVSEKSLPPGAAASLKGLGNRGSWRGHLNAIQKIVEEGWESALILEDDIDWDIRLKDQMVDLSRGVQLLGERYSEPTIKKPKEHDDAENLLIGSDSTYSSPRTSPYGDNWDLLWLGHCGTRFPDKEKDPRLPRSRAVLTGDVTVPQTQHLVIEYGSDAIKTSYPQHTRVFHHTAENVCCLAYAVTQKTARQILHQLSLVGLTGPFDIALRNFCDGHEDTPVRRCWTTTPTYFDHHRPVGYASRQSDINDNGNEQTDYNTKARTANIRWAVRMNLDKLVEGETEMVDQWPDAT